MGGACSGDSSSGAAYGASDPTARLSPEQLHALVQEKLRSSLFSGLLSTEQLAEFARFFTVRTYPPEALVIRKGATIDAMYVVGEGSVRMEVGDDGAAASSSASGAASPARRATNSSAASPGGGGAASSNPNRMSSGPNAATAAAAAKKLLCIKKTGEYFGEAVFAEGKPGMHDLNVVTGSGGDCMLLVLTRAQYGAYIKRFPEMGPVVRSVAMSMEKQLQQLEFFQGIEPMKMKMLVTMFQFVPLMEGAVLFHENDFDRELGNSLYFLYKGRVKVINSEKSKGGAAASAAAAEGGAVEEKVLNTLEPGCFFGEVGLMMDIPRTATIQAVESSLLLELSQKNFRHFITIVPEILQKFNSVLLEYNIHLRYFIHNPLVLNYFMQFCKGEHSSENIEFWEACRDFRRLDPKSGKVTQSEMDQRAAEIKKMYIGNSASQQVNLKGSVEAKVMKGLKEVPIKNTVFIDAEEEILGLMSSDSFGRFKSSDLFKTCIETVNSPYTAILRKLYLL